MRKEIGGVLRFAKGCWCFADCDGRDAGLGDRPKGVLLGLGKRQRSLKSFLLLCFSLLSICAEGNGGLTAVCCVLRGMLDGATH